MKHDQKQTKIFSSCALTSIILQHGQFGVKYHAVKTWNKTQKASMSIKSFRIKYKHFLLQDKPIADICLYSSGQDLSKP